MIVKWNVDTGYVNRMPDREIEIDDDELEGLSDDEKENVINEAIEQAFNNEISWHRVS